jgi:hypothetical protein
MNQNPNTDPMQDLALALYYRVAELVKAGKTREQIIAQMGLQGVRKETVEMMLDRLAASRRNMEKRRGRLSIAVGGLITLLALGLLFGWFGLPVANDLAFLPAMIALGVGGYWLVRGMLDVMNL